MTSQVILIMPSHSKHYCAQGLLQYPRTKDNGTELYHELKAGMEMLL